MRYVPPLGVSDPEASYINGLPGEGRQGSIPPAAVFENPQREIVNVIAKSKFTPTDADLLQLAKSVRSQALNFGEDIGIDGNNLIVAFDPPLTSYTPGLVIRVLIKIMNTTNAVRINAGAGNVRVRKMDGADVGAEQLKALSLITLVFDGTAFQLTNFGGAGGGPGDVYRVNIPYDVDRSTDANLVRAIFLPTELFEHEPAAGEVVAVKITHTNTGPITFRVNNLIDRPMLPNGGGGDQALQGDIHAGDVITLFFDGNAWWFTPNPEIDARVEYTVNPAGGGHYTSLNEGMAKLGRKTIGATGYVTFQLVAGVYHDLININHPSGDRICVRGTYTGPNFGWNEFAANGNTALWRSQDAVSNLNLMRSRWKTEIVLPHVTNPNFVLGVINSGPGRVTFENLLIIGQRLPFETTNAWSGQTAFDISAGKEAVAINCAVWGCGRGFRTDGDLWCIGCFVCGSIIESFGVNAAFLQMHGCGAYGGERLGINSNAGALLRSTNCVALQNDFGFTASNNSSNIIYYGIATGNAVLDLSAQVTSSIILYHTYNYITTSPALNVPGNLNSAVANATGM